MNHPLRISVRGEWKAFSNRNKLRNWWGFWTQCGPLRLGNKLPDRRSDSSHVWIALNALVDTLRSRACLGEPCDESCRSQAARFPQKVPAICHSHLPTNVFVDREGMPAVVGRHIAHRFQRQDLGAFCW